MNNKKTGIICLSIISILLCWTFYIPMLCALLIYGLVENDEDEKKLTKFDFDKLGYQPTSSDTPPRKPERP